MQTSTTSFVTPSERQNTKTERAREAEQFYKTILPSMAYVLDGQAKSNDATFISSDASLPFESVSVPEISVKDYLDRIFQCADCSNSCFFQALIYLDRLQKTDFTLASLTVHRSLLICIMLATKYMDDSYESNESWSVIGGMDLDEINNLESYYLTRTGFNLYVSPEEFTDYEHEFLKLAKQLSTRKSRNNQPQRVRSSSPKAAIEVSACS